MINDYKDEITNLTKVVRYLTYTIQGACELFINTNKELLSSKSIVETTINNKKLNDELERTQNGLSQLEIINKSLSDDLEAYSNTNKEFYDAGYWNDKEQRIATIEEIMSSKGIKPKNKLKLRPIGVFRDTANNIGKALTDKDIADISAPLDLHGLHLNEETPLENDIQTTRYMPEDLIARITELSKYTRRYLNQCNITTFGQLMKLTENEMTNIKYLGPKSIKEVQELLNSNKVMRGY